MDSPIYHLEGVVKSRSEEREDFTGPLDLILHLLSKNRMEIRDIQISLILEQYLEWMERRKELDLEIASEFVQMAAQLIFIKTRMLLSIQDEEALSEMEALMASLEEHQSHENYARIKAVLPQLKQGWKVGQDYMTKPPERLPEDRMYHYSHKKEELYRALLPVLSRSEQKRTPPMAAFEGIVGREPYPVADKAGELLRRLLHSGVTHFLALFRGSRSRSEVVATFLAVLELCKARRLLLTGTDRRCTVAPVLSAPGEEETKAQQEP